MKRIMWFALAGILWSCSLEAQVLTLPRNKRPEWLQRDGIVMAGSWEPLMFRVRRDGAPGYTPTAEDRRAYEEEHSPGMVARLKELGVNFVMMHCHKGAGMAAERESMDDAVRFARLCHDAGLRVGVYLDSGTFLYEFLFKEKPEAQQWIVLDREGKPIPYGRATYRYYWNRNHPDGHAYYRLVTKFAVEKIQTDLLHYDNYFMGPGWDDDSVQRFRRYLQATFDPATLRKHDIDPASVRPPAEGTGLLRRAWQEFCCRSLSESYHQFSAYARTLQPDVLVECNPGGVRPMIVPPVNHGRLYTGGEAVWDESGTSGWRKGRLQSHIRTYKIARSMDNMVFAYTPTPLEAAESMAFNLDCLGAICWFEYARFTARPGIKDAVSADLPRYVKFFHQRRDLLRSAKVVADLAVLRSFPSMVFGEPATAALTGAVEDALISDRACFQILYEHQWDRLNQFRGLVLAGCAALSDAQVEQIRRYVREGGRLCVIGPLATHDQWMLPRTRPALDDLPEDRVQRVTAKEEWLAAAHWAAGGQGSLSISVGQHDLTPGLCAELTEQPNRRMVHLVNYRDDRPFERIRVRLALPPGKVAQEVKLASPEHDADIRLPLEQEPGEVTFTVPKVTVYEIAVVNLK